MKTRPSILRTMALLAAVIIVAGMTVPAFVPTAQALYWEDDYEGNHPKERKRRPGGFFLFNWIGGLVKKADERQYGRMEDRDTGSSVNKGRRATMVVACGLVGLGTGLLVAKAATNDPTDETSNMFVGGALGFGAGVLIASVVMPRDYQVDPVAQSGMKFRQAWLQDGSCMTVRASFHPVVPVVRARF